MGDVSRKKPAGFTAQEADGSFDWDAFVERSPQACFSHLQDWIAALSRTLSMRTLRVVVRHGTVPVAICPFFLRRRGPLVAAYSPPPESLLHHMGVALLTDTGLSQRKRTELLVGVQTSIDEFLSGLSCNYVEMRLPPGFLDVRSFLWAGYEASPLYTYVVDLTPGRDEVWRQCAGDLRRNVARCEGHVIVREATPTDLPALLALIGERFAELGLPHSVTEPYIQALRRSLPPERLRFFVAGEHGSVQTGLVLVLKGHRASIWYGAVRPHASSYPVNDFLHWKMHEWAIGHGFPELEIMDADNRRLEEFKSKFNPRLHVSFELVRGRRWYRVAERIGRTPPSLF